MQFLTKKATKNPNMLYFVIPAKYGESEKFFKIILMQFLTKKAQKTQIRYIL